LVNKIQEEYEKNESGIDKTNKELTDKRDELNRITKDLEILEGEIKFLHQNFARQELNFLENNENIENLSRSKQFDEQRLEELNKDIENVENELKEIDPLFLRSEELEKDLRNRLEENQTKLQNLFAKQNRIDRYKTKDERDKKLKSEIKELEKEIESRKEQITALENSINELEAELEKGINALGNKEKDIKEQIDFREELNGTYNILKVKRDETANKRKELWKNESDIETNLIQVTNELETNENKMYSSLSRDRALGLKAVKRIKEER